MYMLSKFCVELACNANLIQQYDKIESHEIGNNIDFYMAQCNLGTLLLVIIIAFFCIFLQTAQYCTHLSLSSCFVFMHSQRHFHLLSKSTQWHLS